jgi:ABC-2 type transport system ATP-binding protein
MSNPAIAITGLDKSFSAKRVLSGLTLEVPAGSVYGLVGLNGAGKTTLIRLLTGLLRPDAGAISVLGHDPWTHAPEYYRQTGIVLEHDGFFGALTFGQNLDFFARARGVDTGRVRAYLDEHWGAHTIVGSATRVRDFSRGQRMQCALCRCFLGWPRVCFLDEPTVGLDVEEYEHFHGLVRQARDRGATVLISSHQMATIENLCDAVGVLRDGAIHPVRTFGRGVERWMVRVTGGKDVGALIAGAGGEAVAHDGVAWRFVLSESRTTVPAIVAALVAAGCGILEVARDRDELRDAVKRAPGTGVSA